MRGRKPFSLGSGSIFRINALLDVEGFDEETITEDVSTSIDLHSAGWESIYVDRELAWYGIPPLDLRAYLSQQSRWAFGSFQMLKKLLKSSVSFSTFIDYFAGWLYWFKVGPITLGEMIAPIVFLLLSIRYIYVDPVIYLLAYMSFFISSIVTFAVGMRDVNYSFRSFVYHNSIQLIEFPVVTSSFVSWILRKRQPFRVTPKKVGDMPVKLLIPHIVFLELLVASVIKGMTDIRKVSSMKLLLVYAINLMWAIYFIPFLAFGIYIVKRYYGEERKVRFLTPLSSGQVCTQP